MRQEKIPSGFVRFFKFCPILVTMKIKEVLPMMVDLFQSHPQPPPEPFKIPNFKSSNIFENDL